MKSAVLIMADLSPVGRRIGGRCVGGVKVGVKGRMYGMYGMYGGVWRGLAACTWRRSKGTGNGKSGMAGTCEGVGQVCEINADPDDQE